MDFALGIFRALLLTAFASAQLALLFDAVVKEESDCADWDPWSESKCMWVNSKGTSRWRKPLMDQLTPTCRDSDAMKIINKTIGKVVSSSYELLRLINHDQRPCGYCSFKMRCGRNCKRRFRTAEEKLCDNIAQGQACRTVPEYYGGYLVNEQCKLWPHPLVDLSQIPAGLQAEATKYNWINCIPAVDPKLGVKTCHCCCTPYKPNPTTFECERDPNQIVGKSGLPEINWRKTRLPHNPNVPPPAPDAGTDELPSNPATNAGPDAAETQTDETTTEPPADETTAA